jgi:hypothetical protein
MRDGLIQHYFDIYLDVLRRTASDRADQGGTDNTCVPTTYRPRCCHAPDHELVYGDAAGGTAGNDIGRLDVNDQISGVGTTSDTGDHGPAHVLLHPEQHRLRRF